MLAEPPEMVGSYLSGVSKYPWVHVMKLAHSHHHALHIVVRRVVGIQHVAGNERAVGTCITLTRHVHIIALHAECIDKVLPEPHELLGHIVFVGSRHRASGEPSADGLFDPNHVCELMPA